VDLLSRTFSGSSTRVDYRRLLEMNTQDTDEDLLFRQEMRYTERGAGGFSNIRRAKGEDSRASLPVQPLEEPRRWLGSELAPEGGGVCSEGARRTDSAPVLRKARLRQLLATRGRNLQDAET